MKDIKCPYCKTNTGIRYIPNAKAKGIHVICENKKCKKEFEVKVN